MENILLESNSENLFGFADKLLRLLEQQQIAQSISVNKDTSLIASNTRPLWLLAYSGGVDSHVLLHQIVQLFNDVQFQERAKNKLLQLPQLAAIHIDHGLQSHSGAWAHHCQKVCDELGVNLHVGKAELELSKNIEAEARLARYQLFAECIIAQQTAQFSESCLFLGQHQQDQVETFLYRLVRGAGLRGLQGMPEQCLFTEVDFRFNHHQALLNTQLIRPLLNYSKAELLNYAMQYNLTWVEDPSNQQTRYDRNFIRKNVLAILQKRWPQFQTRLVNNLKFLQQSQAMLDELAKMDLAQSIQTHNASNQVSSTQHISQFKIDAPVFSFAYFYTVGEGKSRCLNALQYWLKEQSNRLAMSLQLTQTQQQQLIQSIFSTADIAKASKSSVFSFTSAPFDLCQFRQSYYLLPTQRNVEGKGEDVADNMQQSQLWNSEKLNWQSASYVIDCDNTEVLKNLTFEVRTKPSAATMTVRNQQRQLKKLLQEAAVPAWCREQLPYIYLNDELVAVAHVIRSDMLLENKLFIRRLPFIEI